MKYLAPRDQEVRANQFFAWSSSLLCRLQSREPIVSNAFSWTDIFLQSDWVASRGEWTTISLRYSPSLVLRRSQCTDSIHSSSHQANHRLYRKSIFIMATFPWNSIFHPYQSTSSIDRSFSTNYRISSKIRRPSAWRADWWWKVRIIAAADETQWLIPHLAHTPKAYDPDDHIDYLDATVHFDDTCQVRFWWNRLLGLLEDILTCSRMFYPWSEVRIVSTIKPMIKLKFIIHHRQVRLVNAHRINPISTTIMSISAWYLLQSCSVKEMNLFCVLGYSLWWSKSYSEEVHFTYELSLSLSFR